MPAPKHNTYAAKPAKDRADAQLQMRCRGADKRRWIRASKARAFRDKNMTGNITGWIRDTLNAEAAYEESLVVTAR
jgi:hypothetical protein